MPNGAGCNEEKQTIPFKNIVLRNETRILSFDFNGDVDTEMLIIIASDIQRYVNQYLMSGEDIISYMIEKREFTTMYGESELGFVIQITCINDDNVANDISDVMNRYIHFLTDSQILLDDFKTKDCMLLATLVEFQKMALN